MIRGLTGPQLISQGREFVVGQGWVYRVEYQGNFNDINGLGNGLRLEGYDFVVSGDGPIYTLQATRQAIGSNDFSDFYDRFTMNKEFIEKDIFEHPTVRAESAVWVATPLPGQTNTQTKYRQYITNYATTDDHENKFIFEFQFGPPNAQTYPVAHQVAREIARGVTHYETEYLVMTRERMVSIVYGQKLTPLPGATSKIYSLRQISIIYDFPNGFIGIDMGDVVNQQNDTSLTDTRWGWRNRRNEVTYIGGIKAEVLQDFAFAAWSTWIYESA